MTEFLHNIVSLPMLPYTIVLGLVVLYWAVSSLLAFDLDFLDGVFGGLDGAAEGAVDGAVDGITDAALDAAVDGAVDGALEGTADGAADGAVEGAAHGGFMHTLCAMMNLGQVPATIVLSVLVLWMWFLAYLFNFWLMPKFGTFTGFVAVGVGLVGFVVVFMAGVYVTGLVTRPLKKHFVIRTQRGHHHLVGQPCTIKTTKVTEKFGQAEIGTESGPLLLSVRCPDENTLTKGSSAVLVDYNHERDVYTVKAM